MYKFLNEIIHDVQVQCHGNYIEMKNHLHIDNFEIPHQISWLS